MENQEKRELYVTYKKALKLALKYEFWLQAIFIEYAILEDRLESVLRHEGNIKLKNRQGHSLKLSDKINKIRSHPSFIAPKVRKYLSLALLKELETWKECRNKCVHRLMNTPYDGEEIKAIALAGEELVKSVDSKVKSVNRIFDKKKGA